MIHQQEQLFRKQNTELKKKLAEKARELKIESSLERVRVVAMKMNKPAGLLDVSKTMYKEFYSLGFDEIRNAMINIHNDAEKTLINYDYSDAIGKSINHLTYNIHPLVEKQIKKIRSANDAFSETYFTGSDLVTWKKMRKKIGEKDDPRLNKNKGLYYYFYSIGTGSIGISTFGVISNEKKKLLKRFRNVFNLSYQRYIDIEKAEAQARESQIEAALERVRSKTMSMHNSEDVSVATAKMFTELEKLGVENVRCGIAIVHENKTMEVWSVTNVDDEKTVQGTGSFDMNAHKLWKLFYDTWKNKSGFLHYYLKGKEKEKYISILNNTLHYLSQPILQMPDMDFQSYHFKEGAVWTFSMKPHTEKEKQLMKRFTSVFSLTFRRYQDLKKAEAQAREAQIEIALEKVRSRSLAMHKSEEIQEVINEVFIRLKELEINLDSANIFIFEDGTKDIVCWTGSIAKNSTSSLFRYADIDFLTDLNKAKENHLELLTYQYSHEQKNDFFNYVYETTALKETPEKRKQFILEAACHTVAVAFSRNIAINLNSYSRQSFEESEINIAKRFAKVFEQSYTRFLDLQKAEAQAREAQIQLALERVRARTMSMQKTSEFVEVVDVIGEQFIKLGFDFDWVNFSANGIDVSNGIDIWNFVVIPGKYKGANRVFIPFFDHPVFTVAYEKFQEYRATGNDFYALELDKETKDKFADHLFANTVYKDLPDELKKIHYDGNSYITSSVFLKDTWLSIGSYKGKPFTDEQNSILKRFGNGFGQAYTRFLDLQKAEAQAREAQIEASLERVRSKTMAMHQSNELAQTALLLFQQLQGLGLSFSRTGFYIWQKDTDLVEGWASNGALDGILPSLLLPFKEDKGHRAIYETSLKGELTYEQILSGEELKKHYEWLMSQPTAPKTLRKRNKSEYDLMQAQYKYAAIFKGGYLLVIAPKPQPDAKDLLERFAKVFQQTYTRFLDLQKAEAQAREAQIELGLERVRARAMATHNSEELKEVVRTLFEELTHLDVNLQACLIATFDGATLDQRAWMIHLKTNEPYVLLIPHNEQPFYQEMLKAWKERNHSWTYILEDEAKIKWESFLFSDTDFRLLPKEVKEGMQRTGKVFFAASYYNYGAIQVSSPEPFSNQSIGILQRFSKVFDSSYTRFLDLQKAEAQAREAQIEAALERVRSRTMGMHKSTDLLEVISVLSEQFLLLGFKIHSANFNTSYREKDWNLWLYNPGTPIFPEQIHIPYLDNPFFNRTLESIAKGKDFASFVFTKKEKDEFLDHLYSTTIAKNASEERKKFSYSAPGFAWSTVYLKNTSLTIANYDAEPYTEEQNAILRRFGNVFEQSYTRFLDLQKAEAQAREAQIEAALERVRAQSMAMSKSEDLALVVSSVFIELEKLNVKTLRCGIGIINGSNKNVKTWITTASNIRNTVELSGDEPLTGHTLLETIFTNWKAQKSFSYTLEGNDLINYYKTVGNTGFQEELAKEVLSNSNVKHFYHCVMFPAGGLFAFSETPFSDETYRVLKRFGDAFYHAYKRFEDLQRAEAQAREAKIEAGLERVRSRAMAMQTSEELRALIGSVFTELTKLDLQLTRCVIWIFDAQTNGATWWMANSENPQSPINCEVPFNVCEPYRIFLEQWKKKAIKFQYELKGKIKKDWDNYLFNKTGLSRLPDFVISGMRAPESVLLTASFNNFGAMNTASLNPLSDEHADIMLRFAKVFDLTYTRFNDLKQAEAQAREAKIEAALEKVRGKAMAMHNSNDLSSTASIVFTELRKLGINPIRCGVGLLSKESSKAQLYSATSSTDGDSLALIGWVELSGHPVLKNIYDTWIKNEEYFPELTGKQLKSYYELLLKGLSVKVPEWQSGQKQYGTFLPFSIGCLYSWSEAPYNEQEIKILKRFANIVDLTFRRYLDLQKSETAAKEAIKQAALDRIRADIASMRTTKDLEKITPLIWNELNILGVPFIRCGVFIMDDEQQLIHTFLSTPDGKAIAAFHLLYNTPGNIAQVLSNWQQKKNYIDHWNEQTFTEFAHALVKQGAFSSIDEYMKTLPAGGFYLHFLPFLQGMLYVGNTGKLAEEEINLLQSVADAFSTAYSRYEDFNKLEAAKKQVDFTLNELQATQKQLIQSEKMASLGELTAGIAHEIQNPLNFVNNFSDVNKELLEEMKDEMEKGNMEEVKAIANDIIENEGKINHHGKRADAIVKGMLQHSRKSSGQKEPTDINALADEYLRLSYHGLRAKDKTFNAGMKTDFDSSIGKINIIPQDIGRVILNLITNAFYAASLPSKGGFKKHESKHEPTIWLSTKKTDGHVEIRVRDNGPGIPQNIVDKIFQPFFTTKPTGEGTGLGLSLSYDIIKAHGGEIKVETKEGEGSEFIILLQTEKNT